MTKREILPILFDFGIICFGFYNDEKLAICCVNLSDNERKIPLPDNINPQKILLCTGGNADISSDITLSPKTACIISAV
jgi:hypothetical protein